MGSLSILAAITSIITYFQSIGLTVNLPSVQISYEFRKVLTIISNFFKVIVSYIPSLPAFDIRSQIAILSLGVPLLLDIVFVWFSIPLPKILLHLLDLACSAGATYFLSSIVFGNGSVWYIVGASLLAFYLMAHIIFHLVQKRREKQQPDLLSIATNICNYHLSGIVPGVHSDTTIAQLSEQIQSYAKNIEIIPPGESIVPALIFLFLGLSLIILGLWFIGVLNLPDPASKAVSDILPIVFFPIGGIFLIIFVLKITSCGRKFILGFKNFCQRWGLRLLMLALDLLYIPVLTIFLSLMIPANVTSGAGFYLRSEINSSYWYNCFLNHTVSTLPCSGNYTSVSYCSRMCSGNSILRVADDHSLRYVEDVIYINGGVFLYAVICVMIGVPLLWFTVIKRNQRLVFLINAYGVTAEDKWMSIITRLHSTGIFLFSPYKYSRSTWSIWLIFAKFAILVITTLAAKIFSNALYILPAFYIILLFICIQMSPYLDKVNTIVDCILYFCNFIYTVIPVADQLGAKIPSVAITVLSMVISFIPVLSLIIFIILSGRKMPHEKSDPTLVRPLSNEDKGRRQEAMKKHRKKKKGIDGYVPIDIGNTVENEVSEEDWENIEFPEDDIAIQPGELDSICSCAAKVSYEEKGNLIGPEEKENVAFVINTRTVAKRVTAMYKMIDIVLDGSTISLLTNVLNNVLIFGALVAGWYVGSLMQLYSGSMSITC